EKPGFFLSSLLAKPRIWERNRVSCWDISLANRGCGRETGFLPIIFACQTEDLGKKPGFLLGYFPSKPRMWQRNRVSSYRETGFLAGIFPWQTEDVAEKPGFLLGSFPGKPRMWQRNPYRETGFLAGIFPWQSEDVAEKPGFFA
ncbi:hypothetical protein, partial [Microseira sp. BLCC-F43]|uniref:hypothetical protein n=1 Tax=Microseira sp. BLCC-F43 TaxID=3153602 RepID=UPI0035BA6556